MKCIIRTDGGARGNPGPAGIGVVVEDAESGEVLERISKYLGRKTNNQAEYQAVIVGLEACHARGAKEVEVVADSELLIKQATGEYRVKNEGLAPLFAHMKYVERQIGKVKYRHVRREYNKDADELANQAMDEARAKGE